jgi:hypothetical protein
MNVGKTLAGICQQTKLMGVMNRVVQRVNELVAKLSIRIYTYTEGNEICEIVIANLEILSRPCSMSTSGPDCPR